jgi:cubilin
MTFTSFDVEFEENCSYDALTIYDGSDHTDKSLGRLCGKVLPKDVITSSNKALVTFESDNSVDGRGFQLDFFSGKQLY